MQLPSLRIKRMIFKQKLHFRVPALTPPQPLIKRPSSSNQWFVNVLPAHFGHHSTALRPDRGDTR